jgi:NADPH-ferrihemoprotein reductase
MKGVNYCVFGLGKSSYEHYNAMGIYFASAFEQLGGKLIHKNGLGDDMGTLDDDFDLWKSTLY